MALTSIISLLDNVDERVKIHLMHDFDLEEKLIPIKIKNHMNLESINFIKFNDDFSLFPNTKKSHVSRATYYRLFLEDYFKDELDEIVYLDSDTVIIKNPLPYFKNVFHEMDNSGNAIACFPHFSVPTHDPRNISIGINSGLYFNAGVMLINLKMWNMLDIKQKSQEIIYEKKEQLMLWDQDVLNIIFDGKFYFLDSAYNHSIDLLTFDSMQKEIIKKKVFIIHFFGKVKPWTISGIRFDATEYYQKEFRKLFSNKYHIVKNKQLGTFKPFLDVIYNKKIQTLHFPKSFIYESFLSLFR